MDPITLSAVGIAGLVGLVAFFRRGGSGDGKQSQPQCDSAAALQQVAGETVSGASAGVPVGPGGIAGGAALGLALGATSNLAGPCGSRWINHAKGEIGKITRTPCEKAAEAYAALRRAGGSIPGWDKLSCDQKLAAVIALGPTFGLDLVAMGIVAGAGLGALSTTQDNLTHTNTTVGSHGTTVAGHKIF